MKFLINDLELTLEKIFGPNPQFVLKKVSDWNEHSEDKNAKKVRLGYKYLVADLNLVIKFEVKVEGDKPVLTNEQVQKSSTPIGIAFTDAPVTIYGDDLRNCQMSVKADKATIKPATKG